MSIRLSHSLSVRHTPRVTLNPGGLSGPFAVVELDEDGRTYLTATTPAECDEMIRAWMQAKSLLLGETSEPIPAPGPAPEHTPTCLSLKPGTSTSCQRPAGHAGGHKNYAKDDYWPQDSAGDDAGRAIAAAQTARIWAVFEANEEPGREDTEVAGPFTHPEADIWAIVNSLTFAGPLYIGRARTDVDAGTDAS